MKPIAYTELVYVRLKSFSLSYQPLKGCLVKPDVCDRIHLYISKQFYSVITVDFFKARC